MCQEVRISLKRRLGSCLRRNSDSGFLSTFGQPGTAIKEKGKVKSKKGKMRCGREGRRCFYDGQESKGLIDLGFKGRRYPGAAPDE